MQQTATLDIGQSAPDFALRGPGGQQITLAEYRGSQPVVLVFFPFAFSPPCSHQLPEIQHAMGKAREQNAAVLGISVDSHFTNTAFARHLGVEFPLLSDFDRKASAAYGVLNDKGFSGRAIFVVDKQGKLIYKDISPAPGEVSQIPSFDRALDSLRAPK
jgi:peroxiredoxin